MAPVTLGATTSYTHLPTFRAAGRYLLYYLTAT
jgi:hypothetical protein